MPSEIAYSVRDALIECLEIQHKVNQQLAGADYLAKNLPFYRAALVEAHEIYDWMGYKWWKKTEINLFQAQLEFVDIFHFMLSDYMVSCQRFAVKDDFSTVFSNAADMLIFFIGEANNRPGYVATDSVSVLKNVDQFIGHTGQCETTEGIHAFCLLGSLGLSISDLVGMYKGKAALNLVRNENGYLDGTYQKTWCDGKEDNYILELYLMDLMDSNRLPLITVESAKEYLQDYYTNNVVTG